MPSRFFTETERKNIACADSIGQTMEILLERAAGVSEKFPEELRISHEIEKSPRSFLTSLLAFDPKVVGKSPRPLPGFSKFQSSFSELKVPAVPLLRARKRLVENGKPDLPKPRSWKSMLANRQPKAKSNPVPPQKSVVSPQQKVRSTPVSPQKKPVASTSTQSPKRAQQKRKSRRRRSNKSVKSQDGDYTKMRMEQREAELVGKSIVGDLIVRENGKGYFIKWNKWRHDRVYMTADRVERVLGRKPKSGTRVMCTISGLGPKHVPWNRQNPFAPSIQRAPTGN